jgi:hypothetical protein
MSQVGITLASILIPTQSNLIPPQPKIRPFFLHSTARILRLLRLVANDNVVVLQGHLNPHTGQWETIPPIHLSQHFSKKRRTIRPKTIPPGKWHSFKIPALPNY